MSTETQETIRIMRTVSDQKKLIADILMHKYVTGQDETFFNTVPMLFCIADANGYLILVNEQEWVIVLGYDSDAIRAVKFISFIHPEDVEKTEAMYQTLLSGGICENWPNRYKKLNGEYVTLNWFCRATKDRTFIICSAYENKILNQ